MPRTRKNYSAEMKAKIALEAIKGQRTINEISSHYDVHPNQVMNWKKQAMDQMASSFGVRAQKAAKDEEIEKAQLYQQIGQLKVELDWLKKKVGLLD